MKSNAVEKTLSVGMRFCSCLLRPFDKATCREILFDRRIVRLSITATAGAAYTGKGEGI